jgi:NitT/TauT family transport system ATP-binding protein
MPSDGDARLAAPASDEVGTSVAGDTVIDIRNLSLTFQTADAPVHALSDINLQVGSGEFVSLIGPSGCGKTTLMRIVADLEQPTGGTALVNGMTPQEARLNRAYGYVFQAPALYPWRNVLGNVTLPHEIFGMSKVAPSWFGSPFQWMVSGALRHYAAGKSKAEGEATARRYLELVGLSGFEKKFPWQLSGGMQQRVSIARALSFDPAILLMDEPFGALDEITRDRMNEELLSIWRKTRKTVIFVTHSIDEAVLLSTRIVVMSARPGRIVEVIDSTLPPDRSLETRESPAAVALAHRVREGLKAGHSYD